MKPLGRAATTRALQKWNWSSKTTDHRLGTVAWLKSLLSPEVTVSAMVHGHKLAQRTLTSINNFFFSFFFFLYKVSDKLFWSAKKTKNKNKTEFSIYIAHIDAKSHTKCNEVASAYICVQADIRCVALFDCIHMLIWFIFIKWPLDVLQLKNTMRHQCTVIQNITLMNRLTEQLSPEDFLC